MASETVKQRAIEALQTLPDDSTIDDAIERLCLIEKIDEGLLQADAGRLTDRDDVRKLITRDPGILGGQPVLKGTRVTLNTVLSSLAEGATVAQILDDFPTLTEEHVRAAIAFAAASAQEDLPVGEVPVKR